MLKETNRFRWMGAFVGDEGENDGVGELRGEKLERCGQEKIVIYFRMANSDFKYFLHSFPSFCLHCSIPYFSKP